MADEVRVERSGATATLWLARPQARNALNLAMCHGLREAFEGFETDADLRVVLIRGEGPGFCAGADLKERKDKDAPWVRMRRMSAFAAYDAIQSCAKPVVALVHGPVVGSGGEIALCADFIVAASDTTFRFPEPQWGTVGATQRLQRAIGIRTAKDLLFTGRALHAGEALSLGLVSRVVEPDRLDAAGAEVARAIGAAPPLALKLTKQAMDLGSRTDLDSAVRIEMAAIDHNLAVGEWQAGIDKFWDSVGAKPGR